MATQENAINVGSSNWNVADLYSKFKIMKLMMELDEQEKIAMFGKIDEYNMVLPEDIPIRREQGMKQIIFLLNQLIGNCRFAVKDKRDKELMGTLLDRVRQVEERIEGISNISINDVTKQSITVIDENHFRVCFNILRDVKDGLNDPLDRASLIFRQTDDVNLDDIMNQIVEGA